MLSWVSLVRFMNASTSAVLFRPQTVVITSHWLVLGMWNVLRVALFKDVVLAGLTGALLRCLPSATCRLI